MVLGAVLLLGWAAVSRIQLGVQSDGSYYVSSGQRIELLGATTKLEGLRPKDLAVSPDGESVALLTHAAVVVVDSSAQIKASLRNSAAPLGIAWSRDGSHIYAAEGNGQIGVFDWNKRSLTKRNDIAVVDPGDKRNPGTGGLAVGPDGTLYAALSIRNKVLAISPEGTVVKSWGVGACPYHLALSPDGTTLAVANRGGSVVAPNPMQGDPVTRNAFNGTGVAHADSDGTEVQIDPRTDASLAGTLSLISVGSDQVRTVSVGNQPSGLTFTPDGKTILVADSNADSLSFVDPATGAEQKRIPLAPKEDPTFGQIPTSVTTNEDASRIYVALGGANSVAVLANDPSPKVLGYFPTAWYPIALGISQNHLLIGCSKGIGSRPSSKTTGFGVHDSVGAVQSFTMDQIRDLGDLTRKVAKNNAWTTIKGPRPGVAAVPVPARIGEPSVFTHVVYIIKENLSYDAVLGDLKPGNGDPSLCTFPEVASPNHHAIARRFGLLDNFYISGTNSADGHQWVDSSIANDYTERNYGANERSYPFDGGDPLAFSPAGFLWSQAKAAGKTVNVFGEFVNKPSIVDTVTGKEDPTWPRCWADYKSGKGEIQVKAETSEAGLRDSLDPTYIGFPLNISDQWRADQFLGHFDKWVQSGEMPNLTIMLLPCDHTVGTSPGWPTPRAEVADNDLAVGRIVQAISHSKYWANTLIVVTEDDSQNGLDHVDGHRSICFCVSAYSKTGENDTMYNHTSIASTIGHILGFAP